MTQLKVRYILLFLLKSFLSFSQPVINVTLPDNVVSCGPLYTYHVEVYSSADMVYSNVQLTFDLPNNVVYQPLSVIGAGVDEQDVSNLNVPVFTLPDIGAEPVEFQFVTFFPCQDSDVAGVISNQVTFISNEGDFSFVGHHNQQPVTLSVIGESGIDTIVNVNSLFSRSFTIQNGGFGSVSQIFLVDEHNPNAIEVEGVSIGAIVGINPTVILLTGSDFATIGNGNDLLDSSEVVTIQEAIRVLSCEDGDSDISISWGCVEQECQSFYSRNVEVGLDIDYPELDYVIIEDEYAGFCNDGFIEVAIINNASENTSGSATAYSISLEPGIGNVIPLRDSCLILNGFSIHGEPFVVDTISFDGYGLSFSQFGVDPDGPGGLDDHDGDGQYDDLAVGDSIHLFFDIHFLTSCLNNNCNEDFTSRRFRLRGSYLNQCGTSFSHQPIYGDDHSYSLAISSEIREIELEYFNETTFNLELQFYESADGFEESCSNDSVVFHLLLPTALEPPTDFQPLFDGGPVDYVITGDTISIISNNNQGLLSLTLNAQCDTVIFEDTSLPCGGILSDPPSLHQIDYWLEYFCDVDECNDPLLLHCEQTPNFILACPIPSESVGFLDLEMTASRTTLGWTDASLTEPVNPADSGLVLENAMTYDTLLFELSSTLEGPGIFDTANVRFSYFIGEGEDLLEYFSDTLLFFDAEQGMWMECSGLGLDSVYVDSLGEKRFEFSLFDLLQSGGCLEGFHFTAGDQLIFKAYFTVTIGAPEAPFSIPDLRGRYVHYYQGQFYECDGVYARMSVFNPFQVDYFSYEYSGLGCDTIQLTFGWRQGAGNLGVPDFFPYEFRPLIRWDSLRLELPLWVEYLAGSATLSYEYRAEDDGFGTLLDTIFSMSDPAITTSSGQLQIDFSEDGTFPVVDYQTEQTDAHLSFKILPHCLSNSNFPVAKELFTTQNLYAVSHRQIDLDEGIDLVDYRVGNRKFSPVNEVFYGITDTANWTFGLELQYGPAQFAPHSWLYFDLPTGDIQLLSLREQISPGQFISHELLPTGNGIDYWVKIDTLFRYDERIFFLEAEFEACDFTTFSIYSAFDCGGYPDNLNTYTPLCENASSPMELSIDPLPANLCLSIEETPTGPVALCEPLDYTIQAQINCPSGSIAGVFGLQMIMELPLTGWSVVPGSSSIRFEPQGTTSFPVADPTLIPGTQLAIWELGHLSEVPAFVEDQANAFWVDFQIELDCAYIPNSTFLASMSWEDYCGNRDITASFVSLPLQLIDQPEGTNTYFVEVQEEVIYACADQNDMEIALTNLGGSSDGQTAENEILRLYLPEYISFVQGSLVDIHNAPSDQPSQYTIDGQQVIEWRMPADILTGDSIVFQIGLDAPDLESVDCGLLPIIIETVQVVGVPCQTADDGLCDISFNTVQDTFVLEVQKPVLTLTAGERNAEVLNTNQETYSLDIWVENTSSFAFSHNYSLAYYYDVNGNQILEPGVDQLVEGVPLMVDFTIPEQSLVFNHNLPIPVDSTCFGLFAILAVSENPCLCSDTQIYFPIPLLSNAGIGDTLCYGTNIELGGTSQLGYNYLWSPTNHLDHSDTSAPIYQYSSTLPAGNWVSEQLVLTTHRQGGCTTMDTVTISTTLLEADLSIESPVFCYGDSTGSLSLHLEGGLPAFSYMWSGGLTGEGPHVGLAAGEYTLTVSDALGCVASDTIAIEEPPPLELDLQVSNYGAFNISCHDGADGVINALPGGGTPPYLYLWNSGATGSELFGLNAGTYSLSVTDANGCTLVAEDSLLEPPALMWEVSLLEESCFGASDGAIQVLHPQSSGFVFSLDGVHFQSSVMFDSLTSGTFTLFIQDSLACITEGAIHLPSPPSILVQAPEDLTIKYGESVVLEPEAHHSVQEFFWAPSDSLSCIYCPAPLASPLQTTIYTVAVTNDLGCTDEDDVRIYVRAPRDLYIPNVFSPNGDGVNDSFTLYSGRDVVKINRLQIFNRWGDLLFDRSDFLPNAIELGWDGTFQGRELNPAVYVYMTEVVFIDGSVELWSGDVVLVK